MTIIDRLRAVEKQLSEIWKLLMAARAAGGAGSGPHNVLSGTHTDSTPAAAVRGDIIVADSNPKWKSLAKGAVGDVLTSGAADVAWAAPATDAHNLLSATHPDALADSPVRGDILIGNSTPKWARKVKGTSGHLLGYDANDVVAINPNTLDVDKVDGKHAADFQTAGTVAAHHASHEGAGGGAGADKIKLDDLDTPDDNTDLNASSSRHGLLKKLENTGTKFLRDDGTWQTVTAGASNAVKLWSPDAFPAGYAAQCDHFDDASIAAKWTTFQSAAALTVAESETFYKFSDTGAGGYIYRGAFQALPAGDFTMMTRVAFQGVIGNYIEMGLMLFEDATNNPNTCKLYTWGFLNGVNVRGLKLNNKSSYGGNFGSTATYTNAPWVRIRRSGTTLYFDWSEDGVGWYQAYSEAQWFTPAEMGVVISNQTAATVNFWFDHFFYKGSNDAGMNACGAVNEFWIT